MKKITSIIALTTSMVTADTVVAQTEQQFGKNPYTLVYEGAITENVKGKVNIHPVTYKLNGIAIAANVYTPANYSTSKKYADCLAGACNRRRIQEVNKASKKWVN